MFFYCIAELLHRLLVVKPEVSLMCILFVPFWKNKSDCDHFPLDNLNIIKCLPPQSFSWTFQNSYHLQFPHFILLQT